MQCKNSLIARFTKAISVDSIQRRVKGSSTRTAREVARTNQTKQNNIGTYTFSN
jgi:hypothetical protein